MVFQYFFLLIFRVGLHIFDFRQKNLWRYEKKSLLLQKISLQPRNPKCYTADASKKLLKVRKRDAT